MLFLKTKNNKIFTDLGPGEIVQMSADGVREVTPPGCRKQICSFLWVYYGYPTSSYEGVNVEEMRYKCGSIMAKRDEGHVDPNLIAGVPDSGIAHAIGYSNEAGIPFSSKCSTINLSKLDFPQRRIPVTTFTGSVSLNAISFFR